MLILEELVASSLDSLSRIGGDVLGLAKTVLPSPIRMNFTPSVVARLCCPVRPVHLYHLTHHVGW